MKAKVLTFTIFLLLGIFGRQSNVQGEERNPVVDEEDTYIDNSIAAADGSDGEKMLRDSYYDFGRWDIRKEDDNEVAGPAGGLSDGHDRLILPKNGDCNCCDNNNDCPYWEDCSTHDCDCECACECCKCNCCDCDKSTTTTTTKRTTIWTWPPTTTRRSTTIPPYIDTTTTTTPPIPPCPECEPGNCVDGPCTCYGEDGSPGPAIPGPAGPKGVPGGFGPPGDGRKGRTGDPGRAGFIGDKGLPGFPGPAGPEGYCGREGLKGKIGEPGDRLRGYQGDKGDIGDPTDFIPPVGEDGEEGEYGPKGFKGYKGYPGHPGSRGELGLPGCKGEPPEVIGATTKSIYVHHFQENEETSTDLYDHRRRYNRLPCPQGDAWLWEGYSLLHTSDRGRAHVQDLGKIGSCARNCSSHAIPLLYCSTNGDCYFKQRSTTTYWLRANSSRNLEDYSGPNVEIFASRCVVCERPGPVFAKHFYGTTLRPHNCPPGYHQLWTGYSFLMHAVGSLGGGQLLGSSGSCLPHHLDKMFLECEYDDGGGAGTCNEFHDMVGFWLLAFRDDYHVPPSIMDNKFRNGEYNQYLDYTSNCAVCAPV